MKVAVTTKYPTYGAPSAAPLQPPVLYPYHYSVAERVLP
jgi:hypothetical protein